MANRKRMIVILVVIVLMGLSFPLKRSCSRFWAVDICVDRGGRFNYETGECEFFNNMNIMSVVLIGREFEGRYSITMEVVSPDALTGAKLAKEHAHRLGHAIIGVREILMIRNCDSCQDARVLKIYDKVFPTDPGAYE